MNCRTLTTSNQRLDADTETFVVAPLVEAFNWKTGSDFRLGFKREATDGLTKQQTPAILGAGAVRRLTPVECERLMSWPDAWTAPEGVKAPDSRRYAACGDGVVANVAEWIGRGILAEHLATPPLPVEAS